jgi:acyl-CoA thioester hydrolase
MPEPVLLHQSIVDASEIDSLGHLNVRYYVQRAREASYALLERAGIALEAGEVIRWTDTFNRFHREQFEGASLETFGGFISDEGFENESSALSRAYFEIRNPDSKTLAASFVVSMHIVDSSGRLVSDQQRAQLSQRPEHFIAIPAHGAPRTLNHKPVKAVSFEEIEAIIDEGPVLDMMSGRREVIVLAQECDAQGRLQEDVDLMSVLHRPQPGENLTAMGQPALADDQGRRLSWAMLETRSFRFHRPAVDDVVISMGANLSMGEKWRYTRRWMFVKGSGQLLAIVDSVGICIDLDARKSVVISPELKRTLAATSLPQFL